jgi:hypothetical protein
MIVQLKMMAGIIIQNFVVFIGDARMENLKNLNVQVVQLGIITTIVVIGLTVSIVHEQRKQHEQL